jgi:hypothetical protein
MTLFYLNEECYSLARFSFQLIRLVSMWQRVHK